MRPLRYAGVQLYLKEFNESVCRLPDVSPRGSCQRPRSCEVGLGQRCSLADTGGTPIGFPR